MKQLLQILLALMIGFSFGTKAIAMCDTVEGPAETCAGDLAVNYDLNGNCNQSHLWTIINVMGGATPSIVSGTEELEIVDVNMGPNAGSFTLQVVYNGDETYTLDVTVDASLDNTLTVLDDAICDGENGEIVLEMSESGVEYQLRRESNDNNVGSPITGTGSDITFVVTGLGSTRQYNVLATSANGGCEIELDDKPTITVVSNPVNNLSIPDVQICTGEDAEIVIESSENNVSYQLRLESNDSEVGDPVAGTGNDITISVSGVTSTTQYNVLATTDVAMCPREMSDKPTVTVIPDPDNSLDVSDDSICPGENGAIVISNSQSGVSYQLRLNSNDNNVGDPVDGDGNDITITVNEPSTTTVYNILATTSVGMCDVELTNTSTITVNSLNTAGSASYTPNVCIDTEIMPDVTITTTGATGIDTPVNLPPGVTASWSSNTITIIGTPTSSGTFNYSIPLTGGCGDINATGTIIVSTENTAANPSTEPTVCINESISPNITIVTTGAEGIGTPSGLPGGVTASWSSNTITISGTPNASGTFPYMIPLTGGCGTVSATGTITVDPQNTVSSASSNPTLCINTPLTNITFTTTGATGIGSATGLPTGVSATWSGNTITISGTPSASGNFNYSIPLTGGCGSLNATGTIIVTPNNTAAAATEQTLCINTNLTNITIATTGATGIGSAMELPAGVTASWSNNLITITGTPSASGTFNYSIPLTGGCGTINATGTITVTPNNTVETTSEQEVCINTVLPDVTINTTGATGIGQATGLPAGVSASWASNVITISGTPTEFGMFNYSIPLTGGCGNVNASGVITINPRPNLEISGSTAFCSGSSTNLRAQEPGGNQPGDWMYEWSDGTTGSGIQVDAEGNYSVIVTDGNGCTSQESVDVVENESLSISISASIGLELCGDETQTLSVPEDTNYSYEWNTEETTSSITAGIGDYSVTVTDNSVMCSGEASIMVTNNERPTATLSANETEYCDGETAPSVSITFTGQPPFDFTYTRNGTPTQVANYMSSTFMIPIVNEGTYVVTALNDKNCPSIESPVSNSITIVKNPLPVVAITPEMPAFCPNSSVEVSVVGTFTEVTWRRGAEVIGNDNSITIELAGTNYSVEVQDGNGCRNTLAFSVVVENNVSVNIEANPGTSICPGETITLDAGANFQAWQWSAPGNQMTQTIDVTEQGTYSVTVTDANDCTGTDFISIEQNDAPEIQSPQTDETLEYCEGSDVPSVVFTLEGEGTFMAMYQFNNNSPQDAPIVGNQVIISNPIPGDYTLVSIEDDNCSTESTFVGSTITIQENLRPDFTLGSSSDDDILCPGGEIDIFVNIENASNFSYDWTLPDLSTSTSQNLLGQMEPGTYSVVVTNNFTNCSSEESIEIEESIFTNIITKASPSEICEGETTELQVIGAASQMWSPPVPPGQQSDSEVEISPTGNGTFFYTVQIVNSDQCSEERTITLTVNPTPAATIVDSKDFYCANSNTDLSVIQNDYQSYEWNTNNEGQSLNVEITEPSTFTVTVTDNKGCTNAATIDINDVRARPTGTIIANPNEFSVQIGAMSSFTADVETNALCSVSGTSYEWSLLEGGQSIFTEKSYPFVRTWVATDIDITSIGLEITDNCNCTSDLIEVDFNVKDNTQCSVDLTSPDGPNCVGELKEFTANTDPGSASPNATLVDAYFTIEGHDIDVSQIDQVLETPDGRSFKVVDVDDNESMDNGIILVEFLDPGQYDYSYYYKFDNDCERTREPSPFVVDEIPEFSSVVFDESVCNNDDQIFKFGIEPSSYNYEVTYTINSGEAKTTFFTPASGNEIEIKKADLDIGGNKLVINELIAKGGDGCKNEMIMPNEYEFTYLDPLVVNADSFRCSMDLGTVTYRIEVSGSNDVGNYAIDVLGSIENIQGSFTEFSSPSGIEVNYEIIDTACPDYSVPGVANEECDRCFNIQDISVLEGNPLQFSPANLCVGETYTFEFDQTFADTLLEEHKIVYFVQSAPVTQLEEANILQEYVRGIENGVDNRFSVEISQDTLKSDVDYYLTAFIVLNDENRPADENCLGLNPIALRWYSNANSTIGLTDDEDGIACQQEIDYQLFIITDPADDLKSVSYSWSSSGNVTFTPENQNIDLDGERALAVFGENPAGPLEIYLDQSYTTSDLQGKFCTSRDTLALEISEIVSPAEDTIIGFPGDLFTFPVSGLCYQWGLNDDLIPGETTQYLALQNGLGNNVLWIDIYDCSDTDPDGLCVTRIYYNAPKPPNLVYKPNEELDIKLIPNPNNGQFTLDFFGDQGGQLDITVVNSTGIPVQRKTVEKESRFQKESFDLMHIDAGLYFIQVIDEGGYRHILKFVKR